MCGILVPGLVSEDKFERKMRFGRILGWVNLRSNFNGCFFELGFCLKRLTLANFILGASSLDVWRGFKDALQTIMGFQTESRVDTGYKGP